VLGWLELVEEECEQELNLAHVYASLGLTNSKTWVKTCLA